MQPVGAPETEVRPDFKVDCPAKFGSSNSFITQLAKAPGRPVRLPRCYVRPSGSAPTTLSQAAQQKWPGRVGPAPFPSLTSLLGRPNGNVEDGNTGRSSLMSAGLGGQRRACVLWRRLAKTERCVQGRFRPSIRTGGRRSVLLL